MAALSAMLEAYRQGDFERSKPIAQFCGVSYRTALEWGRKRDPKGEPLNKLWFFLEAHGHIVDELKKLDPTVRYLAKLLAFGVLSQTEACKLLNVQGHSQYLWRVTQGSLVPLVVRKKSLTQVGLELAYAKVLQEAYDMAAMKDLVPPRRQSKSAARPEVATMTGDSHVIVAAAFISALSPLTKRIVEDGEEAIKALRVATGDDVFYAVLDSLKAMSSRKAHQFYRGKGE